jgi:hypothetical protein
MPPCASTAPQPATLPSPSEVAAELQDHRPGWLIIWSPWRRCFTAFAALSPSALIIDAPSISRLTGHLDQAEMAIRAGKSGSLTTVTTSRFAAASSVTELDQL